MNFEKTVSARTASFCTGLNYSTLKKDIELGRLIATKNSSGNYEIRVIDLVDYAISLWKSERNILICPLNVFFHRVQYMIFHIYD